MVEAGEDIDIFMDLSKCSTAGSGHHEQHFVVFNEMVNTTGDVEELTAFCFMLSKIL